MLKDFIKGIYIGLGILFVFSLVGLVYAVGFHNANEIIPGTFQSGNFSFDGNIGIGTSTPKTILHVFQNDSDWLSVRLQGVNGSELAIESNEKYRSPALILRKDNDDYLDSVSYFFLVGKSGNGGVNGTNLQLFNFYDHDNDSNTVVKHTHITTFTKDGKVGIGTENPQRTFHVEGSTYINEDPNEGYAIWIDSNRDNNKPQIFINADNDSGIRFKNTVDNVDWFIGLDHSDANKLKIGNSHLIGTNTRLTISLGGLGVGRDDPATKLHVAGDATVDGDYIYLGNQNPSGACHFKVRSSGNCPVYSETLIVDGSTYDLCGYCP